MADQKGLVDPLSGLVSSYVPWTSSAMSRGVIAALCNDIVLNSRQYVLEFGSGVSTIFLAAAVRQLGTGRVYSIENDPNWILKVLRFLTNEGLSDYVSFIESPLAEWSPTDRTVPKVRWYEAGVLSESLRGMHFQQIVVDGPIAYQKSIRMSRYPALPFLFQENLVSEKCMILLDDANRLGERKVLRMWEQELGLHFQRIPRMGVAIAVVGDGYNVI
jgi:hypothetical protein